MTTTLLVHDAVWEAILFGDKNAYALAYRVYFKKFYNYGLRFTSNATVVEDCIQETLTAFWLDRQNCKHVKNIDAYLHVCFRNRLIKQLQQYQPNMPLQPTYFDLQISIDQVMIDAERLYEQQVNLTDALQHLTGRQKEAVYLKFYDNLSYDQIAGILEISVKATYKLVARAITELRNVYTQKMLSILFFIGTCLISYL